MWTMMNPKRVSFPNSIGIVRVSCGSDHTLVIDTLCRVWAFGMNCDGQCGVGNAKDVRHPTLVQDLEEMVSHVSAGGCHSLCVMNGQVYSWGNGENGRLGHGNNIGSTRPLPVVALSTRDVKYVSAGHGHSGAIDLAGDVWSWGNGSYGRLGHGANTDQSTPRLIDGLRGLNIVQIAFSMFHSVALTSNGKIYSWGSGQALGLHQEAGESGVFNTPVPIQSVAVLNSQRTAAQIAVGPFHTVCMIYGGDVASWGVGSGGRLGHGNPFPSPLPKLITDFKGWTPLQLDDPDHDEKAQQHDFSTTPEAATIQKIQDVIRLQAFADAWAMVRSEPLPPIAIQPGCSAEVWFRYVRNLSEEQARLVIEKMNLPATIPAEDSVEVLLWILEPNNDSGEEGNIAPWHVRQVSCGSMHSAVVTHGGCLYVWGCGQSGQLGVKVASTKESKSGEQVKEGGKNLWQPRRVLTNRFFRPVEMVACGYEHTLAIAQGGECFAWGKGDSGQLGTGRAKDASEPTKVLNIERGAVHIAAGEDHSIAVLKDGSVFSWGAATTGKLGLGDGISSGVQLLPRKVNSIDAPAQSSSCGPNHSAVLGRDGQVWTFGGGWYGRLGLGSVENQYLAQLVPEFSASSGYAGEGRTGAQAKVSSLSCGAFHTVFITMNKELWMCGKGRCVCEQDNLLRPKRFLHLGDPAQIKYVAAVCGESHTLTVVKEGELTSVFAWGDNRHRQLALGSNSNREVIQPEHVTSIPGSVEFVSTGPSHAFALLATGDLFAWGLQASGRLALSAARKEERLVSLPQRVNMAWSSIEAMTGAVGDVDEVQAEDEGPTQAALADAPAAAATTTTRGGPCGDSGPPTLAPSAKEEAKSSEMQMGRMLEAIREGQKVQRFRTMQTLLKAEKPTSRESELTKKEDGLIAIYKEFVKDIFTQLPEREKNMYQYQSDFEQAFQWNLRWIKAPFADLTNSTIPPVISSKMKVYEQLVWVLQQQVCYLAMLSMCLQNDKDGQLLFYRVVGSIFEELDDSRTLHLFLAYVFFCNLDDEMFLRFDVDRCYA